MNDEQQIQEIIGKLVVMAYHDNMAAFQLASVMKKSNGYTSHQINQLADFMRDTESIRDMLTGYTVWQVHQNDDDDERRATSDGAGE